MTVLFLMLAAVTIAFFPGSAFFVGPMALLYLLK